MPLDTSELDEALKEMQATVDDIGGEPHAHNDGLGGEQHAPDASEEESDSEDEEEGGCGSEWS